MQATDPLSPVIVATTRAAGITAAAGTGLARPFLHQLSKLVDRMTVHPLGVSLSRLPAW